MGGRGRGIMGYYQFFSARTSSSSSFSRNSNPNQRHRHRHHRADADGRPYSTCYLPTSHTHMYTQDRIRLVLRCVPKSAADWRRRAGVDRVDVVALLFLALTRIIGGEDLM
jgi:hypothetical protein